MKLRLFVLFGFLLFAYVQLQAQLTQEKKLTASFKKEPLSVRLKAIEMQTGITIAFDEKQVAQKQAAAHDFANAPLHEVLQQALRNLPLEYKEVNGAIVIVEKQRIVTTAGSQKAAVAVTGKVVDEENGDPVSGATVQLNNKELVTDIDGNFNVQLPAGTYQAEVSSVGYVKKKITDIQVTNDGASFLNVTLTREKSNLQQVMVTASARKEGVAALYLRQQNHAAMTNGISAEQINRTPDKNVGEVMKRVSGVAAVDNKYLVVRGLSERYNQAILDGQVMPSTELNRKNFSFDIVPANIVDNITVIKTLTPDKTAEFGGGMVEVTTLDIPAQNFLNVSVGTNYNDKTTNKTFLSLPLEGKEYRGQVSDSRKLFGRLDWKNPKEIFDYYDASNKNPNLISNNWGLTAFNAQPSTNYQVSLGRILKSAHSDQKWGIIANATYRNTLQTQDINTGRDLWLGKEVPRDGASGKRYGLTTNISGLAGVGFHNKNTRIKISSLYLRTLDQQLLIVDKGSNQNGNWGLNDVTYQTTLLQNQLVGEQAVGHKGVKINYSGSYLYMDRLRPDNHLMVVGAIVDTTQPNSVNITGPGIRFWTRALEKNYSWDASVSVPFEVLKNKQVFKGGYAGWAKDRLFYTLYGSNIANTTVNGVTYYVPLQSIYTPEYDASFDFQRRFFDAYHKTASLHAFYAMLDNKWGEHWRLVWGVRGEYYNLNNVNSQIDSLQKRNPGMDYSELRKREKNLNLFPSANLTYRLNNFMNLRLSYSKSIIRPDLRELVNFDQYDYELGGQYHGNLVHSTLIHHYDFRYEWYPAAGDIISASVFYKKLDYPMAIYQMYGNADYQLMNDKDAKNYGIELEARKSFAFTKVPVLQNITLYGNFTYLDAEVRQMAADAMPDPNNPNKLIIRETVYPKEKRPQSGASNYMYNAGFYFDTRPVSFSLVYNKVTNRMFRPAGPGHQNESLYEQPLQSLDAQLTYSFLHRRAVIKINAANLLNSYSVVYQNIYDDPDLAGSKKDPSKAEAKYQAGKDNVNYKAAPGRTIGVTLSYTFR
jgi:outer membrane receptor protein involved in Fe transport